MDPKSPLRILIVEDLPSDVELAERELNNEGIEYILKHVDTKEDYLKALDEFYPDIVVSDYSMPNFDGMQALELAREKDSSLPFIILTGSMNEETAVECMKAGAWDYVVKEFIKRLPFAIKEAIERKDTMSAREEAERALVESENLFKSLFNTMLNPALILDWDGTIIFANAAAAKIGEYDNLHDIIGKNVIDFTPYEGTEQILSDLKRVQEEGGGFLRDYKIIVPSGKERWVQALGTRIIFKGKDADLVTLADITERKNAELALEKRTHELAERIKELHCVYSIAKLIEERGKAPEIIVREAVDLIVQAMQYPELSCVRITVGNQIYTTDRFIATERKMISDIIIDDNEKIGSVEVFYIGNESVFLKEEHLLLENIAHHFGNYFKRMKAEEEREKLHILLKETQEISRIGGWEYDIITDTIAWTDEVYKIYGVDFSSDPNEYSRSMEFYAPDSAPVIEEAFRRAVEDREPFDLELEFINANGKHLWVRTIGKPVIEDGKPVRVVGNIMDITERKNLEQQILRSQKLESIGQLAGGVAHDLNNVLGAILGHADLGRSEATSDDPVYDRLSKILDLTERGARITQQLLAFSRQQPVETKKIDLNRSLPDLIKLLSKILGEHITIAFNPGAGLSTVNVDPGQIDQVIMNLCINARDAMPDGGELVINTRNVTIDKLEAEHFVNTEPGNYVLISVQDNGTGIKPEHIDRIFDPFFTTKEIGKGTGLGLSVAHGIIGKHKGFIDVQSEINKGTTFNIYLPGVEEEPDELVPPGRRKIQRGAGTILIVEDDKSLRSMIKAILDHNGYTTIVAENGEDGFDQFMRNREKIDLVVSDVVMPKASGKELYERLCAIKPDIRFLFISGYTADIIGQHLMTNEDIDFIPKPFSPYKFTEKIAEILNR